MAGNDTADLGRVSVVVDNISVIYRTETSNLEDLPPLKRLAGRVAQGLGLTTYTKVKALSGVSFQVREGEHVGLVGANGSGKSTLLRVIAGVEPPATGHVLAEATPVLLGVSAAMMPALSGLRNVRLGLLALGFDPSEVAEILPGVVKLAGIGEAIHRPMRTYSSGMGARLRFAIAAAAQPSILLIDEALGTGDAAFADRSKRKINELRAGAGTIFLVSHAAQTIEEMCTRAIWLHKGELVIDGDAVQVARAYRWWAHCVAQDDDQAAQEAFRRACEGDPIVPAGSG